MTVNPGNTQHLQSLLDRAAEGEYLREGLIERASDRLVRCNGRDSKSSQLRSPLRLFFDRELYCGPALSDPCGHRSGHRLCRQPDLVHRPLLQANSRRRHAASETCQSAFVPARDERTSGQLCAGHDSGWCPGRSRVGPVAALTSATSPGRPQRHHSPARRTACFFPRITRNPRSQPAAVRPWRFAAISARSCFCGSANFCSPSSINTDSSRSKSTSRSISPSTDGDGS